MRTVKGSYEVGDIVYVDFGQKADGVHTQGGVRPTLVIIRSGNNYTVIPITSKMHKKLPTHLPFVCKKGSQIGIKGLMLCENTTTVDISRILYYKGSFKAEEPNYWNGTINLVGVQLSKKFDEFAKPSEAKFQRGNLLRDAKGRTCLVVSNEKSNAYGSNVTVVFAQYADRGRLHSLDVMPVNTDKGKTLTCSPLLWNIPKQNLGDIVEVTGRGTATRVAEHILHRIKQK